MRSQIFFLSLTLFFSGAGTIQAQHSNKLQLNADQSGANADNLGCKTVSLVNGYHYKPTPTTSMRAYIDPAALCDIDYSNGSGGTGPTRFNTGAEVGTSAGGLSVSPTGAANYNIPIVISPGTNGMQPNLSIVYNSQGMSGLMGVGWGLAGFSSIGRIGRNLYNDGEVTGVELNRNDRFTLDGSRLISGGDYSQDGTEYHTEAESFMNVKSHGVSGLGPLFFTVQTKEGMTMRYGFNEDSRIQAQGNPDQTVLTWLLDKVTDPTGNYMTISYHEDPTSGEWWPEVIRYSGNSNLGLNPYNEIHFYYNARGVSRDRQLVYVAGSKVKKTALLTNIQITSKGKKVHEYDFNYEYHYSASQLVEIIEKGSDGKAYNSTVIDWNNDGSASPASHDLSVADANAIDMNNYSQFFQGDYNGDGRGDLIALDPNGSWVMYESDQYNTFKSKFSGTFPQSTTTVSFFKNSFGANTFSQVQQYSYSYNAQLNSFDTDGNGKEDILEKVVERTPDVINIQFLIFASTGTSLQQTSSISLQEDDENFPIQHYTGDFDGDGRGDLLLYHPKFNTYDIFSFFPTRHTISSGSLPVNGTLYPIDFNGNGKTDLMVLTSNHSNIYEFIPGGNTFSTLYDGIYPSGSQKLLMGDFNGDGKTDFLTRNTSPNRWVLNYSTGKGFELSSTYTGLDENFDDYFVLDFNGDGRSDILRVHPESTQTQISSFTALGESFATTEQIANRAINNFMFLGDYDGDGIIDILSNTNIISIGTNSNYNNLVSKITNGLNQKTSIYYESIADNKGTPGFYSKGTGGSFPLIDIQSPLYCVRSVKTDDGIGGDQTTQYKYASAMAHTQGKGFLGFGSVEMTNLTTGFVTTSNTIFDPTRFFPLPQNTQVKNGSTAVSSTTTAYQIDATQWGTYFAFPKTQTSVDYLKDVTTTHTINSIDTYGNVTSLNSVTGFAGANDITAVTDNSWNNNTLGDWIISRPASKTVTTTRSGEPAYLRSQNWNNYNALTGLPADMVTDPGTDHEVNTHLTYDDFGNVTKSDVTGKNMLTRSTSIAYDDVGRFKIYVQNPLSQLVSMDYDGTYGNITSSTDINQLITAHTYDGFGRLTTLTLPSGQVYTTSRKWSLGIPLNGVFYEQVSSPNEAAQKNYFDMYGRNIRSEVTSFNGTPVYVDKFYDERGLLSFESEPFGSGSSHSLTYSSFDNLGRLLNVTLPGLGKSITYSYSGNTVSSETIVLNDQFNVEHRNNSMTYTADGLLASSEDEVGTVHYTYASCGKPRIIASPGSSTVITYDTEGFQKTLSDPSAGLIHYEYNALGELTHQMDALGNSYDMVYDKLGRLLTNTGTPLDGVVTYQYDGGTCGKGKLNSITHRNGAEETSCTYTYEALGRLAKVDETAAPGNVMTTQYEYEPVNGKMIKMIYPDLFTIQKKYNSNGYLEEILGAASIWKANSIGARGEVLSATYGNGLTVEKNHTVNGFLDRVQLKNGSTVIKDGKYYFNESTGNLENRQDALRDLSESFHYDKMDRLTKTDFGSTVSTTAFGYNGNITSKSGVGTYSYNTTSKPFAIAQLQGFNPSNTEIQTEQNISYTPFNKTAEITEGADKLTLLYGAQHDRIKMMYSRASSATETDYAPVLTRYYAEHYEKSVYSTFTREMDYISSPDGLAAIHLKTGNNDTMYYVHQDYLGSVEALSDKNGTLVEERSYDAWGRRRNPLNWTYAAVLPMKFTNRGYTGHEHLEQFGIINMNGRCYDPLLGRMLSPDNFVQSLDNTQNFNRYSYVLNNPLKFVDPDGNNPLLIAFLIGAAFGGFEGFKFGEAHGVTGLGLVGYTLGGAAIGGFSAYAGASIAASSMAFANTAGIAYGSLSNSIGMSALSGGQTPVSVGFGFGSYNFTSGEFGYLGKPGNSGLENLGYGLGALGNLSDIANFTDKYTHWEDKLRQQYADASSANKGDVDPNSLHTGIGKSNYVGGKNVHTINGEQFYGAENPTLSDFSAQPHDIAWDNLGMKANIKDFIFNTRSTMADLQLSGRAFYMGIKNLTISPMQAIGSMSLGVGSFISFLPKTIIYPFAR